MSQNTDGSALLVRKPRARIPVDVQPGPGGGDTCKAILICMDKRYEGWAWIHTCDPRWGLLDGHLLRWPMLWIKFPTGLPETI